MAEETYGIQESITSGGDMLNIRGADADEFLAVYQGLIDAAGDNPLAAALVEKYGLGSEEEAPAPKKRAPRTKPKPPPDEEEDEGDDGEYDDEDDEEDTKPRARSPRKKTSTTRSRRTR